MVRLKRAYEPAEPRDGHRVLVERLWPRGLRKQQAHFDDWVKQIAPSDSLRKWFHHDPDRWSEFQRRYARELASRAAHALIDDLARRAKSETVTLIYSAHDREHNNAVVLKDMIERRLRRSPERAEVERLADERIAESFPASDAPTRTSTHVGGPDRNARTARKRASPPRRTPRRGRVRPRSA